MSVHVKDLAFVYHRVSNLARARRFYEQLLGLKVGRENKGPNNKWWIEYEVGNATLGVTNLEPYEAGGGGAKVVLEVANLDAAAGAMRAAGVPFIVPPTEFPLCRMCTITDPDGNQISLHQLKPASQIPQFDRATAEKTEPYTHEPTGRLVGYRQPAGAGRIHLFSTTGIFIATENAKLPRG